MVGGFCGMLVLPAKCPRSPGGWDNSLWKAIRRSILKAPFFLFGAMVEYYPISSRYQSKLHSIRQECFTWNIPRVCIDRGENSGR